MVMERLPEWFCRREQSIHPDWLLLPEEERDWRKNKDVVAYSTPFMRPEEEVYRWTFQRLDKPNATQACRFWWHRGVKLRLVWVGNTHWRRWRWRRKKPPTGPPPIRSSRFRNEQAMVYAPARARSEAEMMTRAETNATDYEKVCIRRDMHTRELLVKAQDLDRDDIGRPMPMYAVIHRALECYLAKLQRKEGGR